MSEMQFRVGGLLLLAVGLAVLVLGGYILYSTWAANAQFNRMDSALGGLITELGHAIGADVSESFHRGGALAAIGAVVATFGFYLLGKVK